MSLLFKTPELKFGCWSCIWGFKPCMMKVNHTGILFFFRTRLEHPLRHAVPESLQINEKNFQQWQSEYDSLLTTLIDLESGKGVSHMI
jgi:hypothetical protein